MLKQAHEDHPDLVLVAGDGYISPLKSRSVDLVTCAQMLHHLSRPVRLIAEMRRVARSRILILDQCSTESFETTIVMNELERIRDPSHVSSRPPSAFRMIVRAAGLEVMDERIVESREKLSAWIWPEEFPRDRIDRVHDFVENHGAATGMDFEKVPNDWIFTRRRMMMLAEPIR